MPNMLDVMIDLMGAVQTSQPVSLEDLEKVCSLGEHGITTPYQSKVLGRPLFVHEVLANFICDTVTKPVVTLLDIESVEKERASSSLYEDYPELTYKQLVEEIHKEPTCKVCQCCCLCHAKFTVSTTSCVISLVLFAYV